MHMDKYVVLEIYVTCPRTPICSAVGSVLRMGNSNNYATNFRQLQKVSTLQPLQNVAHASLIAPVLENMDTRIDWLVGIRQWISRNTSN